jgi:hypothetical protein
VALWQATEKLLVANYAGARDRLKAEVGLEPNGQPGSQEYQLFIELWWPRFSSREFAAEIAVTPRTLAAAASVRVSSATAFLRLFSLTLGSTKVRRPGFSGRHEIRHRPFIQFDGDHFFPVVAENLLWAIRPRLEASLKGDSEAWDRYQARRARFLERQAGGVLRRALQPDSLHTNVLFVVDDESAIYEADLLALVGDVCVVGEVKSGALSDQTRRGRRRELAQDLQSLLGKAAQQVARLEIALASSKPVAFRDRETGAELSIS